MRIKSTQVYFAGIISKIMLSEQRGLGEISLKKNREMNRFTFISSLVTQMRKGHLKHPKLEITLLCFFFPDS